MKLTLFRLFDAFVFNNTDKIKKEFSLETSFSEAKLEELLEKRAVVEKTIQPQMRGRVGFKGSWWPAMCLQKVTLTPGEIVYVTGRCGITLLVEPLHISTYN